MKLGFRWFVTHILIGSLFLSGCIMENQGLRTQRERKDSNSENAEGQNKSGGGPGDQGLLPDAGSGFGGGTIADSFENGRAEIQHIVDPFDGTFRQKVTLPKNFSGFLYLSGLNITSLSDKIVKVKFKFGREQEEIKIPATIGRAPGLTPQTDIEVLILDMRDRPFENMRLLYDLYDYNDYRDLDETSADFGKEVEEPTADPRDTGLYCRGLLLEHDPTFQASSINTMCDETGERCLYAYAKVVDSGLYEPSDPEVPTSEKVAITPTEPQIALNGTGGGYAGDPYTDQIKKCLPDSFNRGETLDILRATSGGAGQTIVHGETITFENVIDSDNDGDNDDDVDLEYRGPFRSIAKDQWEIDTKSDLTSSAMFFDTPAALDPNFDNYPAGLFRKVYGATPVDWDPDKGMGSFLFPRAAKREIVQNIQFFGSTEPFGKEPVITDTANADPMREIMELVSSGDSEWMGGCNTRVSNFDEYGNEGIGSCNVTATIELVADEDGQEILLTETPTVDVKLQLIRPSATNYLGKEVLYTSMKTCSTSRACGSNECCFNNRCWDSSLVSQCLEDADVIGNQSVGEFCESDFACASLCCNAATSACAVHTRTSDDEVLCGKGIGEACVAKEWCRKENTVDCFIVKTGTSPTGVVECALRCFNVPEHGQCIQGTCQPPVPKSIPSFDPSNPDCSSAIDPPTNLPIVPVPSDPSGTGAGSGSGSGDGNP